MNFLEINYLQVLNVGFKFGFFDLFVFIQLGRYYFYFIEKKVEFLKSKFIVNRSRVGIRIQNFGFIVLVFLIFSWFVCCFFMIQGFFLFQVVLSIFSSSFCFQGVGIFCILYCYFFFYLFFESQGIFCSFLGIVDIWFIVGLSTVYVILWRRMWVLCVFIFFFFVDNKIG